MGEYNNNVVVSEQNKRRKFALSLSLFVRVRSYISNVPNNLKVFFCIFRAQQQQQQYFHANTENIVLRFLFCFVS